MRRLNEDSVGGVRARRPVVPKAGRPKIAVWSQLRPRTRRLLPAGIVLVLVLVGSVWGASHAKGLWSGVGTELTRLSVRAGFWFDDARVIGRVHTPVDHLRAALRLKRGESLFAFDVQETKRRLEALPWVRSATVERRLPDTVRLILVEREAVVLWQRKGRYVLLDADGVEIADEITPFRHLPVIVGEKAPGQVRALLAIVKSQPALAPRVRAAQFVSGRRWNLRLDDVTRGIDVRLPEENPAEALRRLVEFDRAHDLLRRRPVMVDLRVPDRLVVRLEDGGQQEQILPAVSREPGRDA